VKIPFNNPYVTGKELSYIADADSRGVLSGEGIYARKCQKWFEDQLNGHKAFLRHSGTAALEMATLLTEIEPGDEVIMPSYTFPSTSNAVVLRGGVPYLSISGKILLISMKI